MFPPLKESRLAKWTSVAFAMVATIAGIHPGARAEAIDAHTTRSRFSMNSGVKVAQNAAPGVLNPSQEDLDRQAAEIERAETEKAEQKQSEEAQRNAAAGADRPPGISGCHQGGGHHDAGLKVQSLVPNAEVFVDGSSLGRAPVDRNDLDPGKHYVVVHKDGYTDFKREVCLVENSAVALVADVSATGSFRVLSTPEGADVRVDGEVFGKTPIQRDGVGVGDHVVELDLRGYFTYKETIKIEGGREKLYSVDLKILPTGPTPEQVAKRSQGMSSFGAKVNPVGGVTTDFGTGYPYYFMARVTVGAFNVKPLGLDLGAEFQTFFDIYNFMAVARLQLVESGPLSIAIRGDGGGGFGPNGRNSYFFDLTGIASVAFSSVLTLSATARWSVWSDKFCPSASMIVNGVSQEQYCKDWTTNSASARALFDKDPNTNRFDGNRLYIGIAATAALDRFTSLFFQGELVPPGTAPRPAFQSGVNGALAGKDPSIYGTAGISLKF